MKHWTPRFDPARDPRFTTVALEWRNQAEALAEYAMLHLVNRTDVWGQYTAKGDDIAVVTLPALDRRDGRDRVSSEKLIRHFKGQSAGHLIGLHASSVEKTSRWLVLDLDAHAEDAVRREQLAEYNLEAALAWHERLRDGGHDPLLLDSDGRGGLHLWVIFNAPMSTDAVHDYALKICNDYHLYHLPKRPEIFPGAVVAGHELGNWCRLPGRHHTQAHFTRLWAGDEQPDNPWLEGTELINQWLATQRSTLATKSAEARSTGTKRSVSHKPSVCVDLDGVLAEYDGWVGGQIGKPIAGALTFLQQLKLIAKIVIYTGRCSEQGSDGIERSRILVRRWLELHGFPFDEIYVGMGKPLATAYVDDRAVSCRPQVNPKAFEESLAQVRQFMG